MKWGSCDLSCVHANGLPEFDCTDDPSKCKGYGNGLELPPGHFTNEGLDDALGFVFMDDTNPTDLVLTVLATNATRSAHDIQFGQIQATVDPNSVERVSPRRSIKKTKRQIRKAKSSSRERGLKKKLRRLKHQIRNLS